MSVNIIFDPKTNEPIRYDEEYFILKSPQISYQINSDIHGRFTGEGTLYITSLRLIITCKKILNPLIKGFSFPLTDIFEEIFKQPFFGKNYLYGKCKINPDSNFGNSNFTIWFYKPPGSIINILFTLLDSYRNNNNRKLGNDILKGLKENLFYQIFAMDNSDPSIIYDIQPDSIPYQNKISQSVIQVNDNNNRPKIGQSMDQKNNINQNPFSINNNHITQSQIQPSFIYKNPGNYHYKESQFVYKENSVCESKTNLIVDNQELVNPYMKNNPQKNISEIQNSVNYNNFNQSYNQKGNYPSNNNSNRINNSQQIVYPDRNYTTKNNLNPKGNYPILVNSYLPNNVQNSFNNNNNNIIRHDSQMIYDVSDSTFSINNENIEVNEKYNINKNDGFNNQNVQLNYNQYPILDQNQNYSRINNENYDKKLKVKINKEDLKYQSIPNDYSYGKVNNNNYSNSLINPYDI